MRSIDMRLYALLIAAATSSTGCMSAPEEASVRWSDAEPIPEPEQAAEPHGWLSVRTARAVAYRGPRVSDPVSTYYRRYAVFDAGGALVYRCDAHATDRDVIALPPGRYVVVANLRDGTQRKAQAIVEANRTTRVDLTHGPDGEPDPS